MIPRIIQFLDTAIITYKLSVGAQQDYHLVKSAIAGDQNAYSLLMSRHHKSVYYQMLKRAKNRHDADDLTIEAFGKAFRYLSSYVPSAAFGTWLVKIAINNCIDHNRKKRILCFSLDVPNEDGKFNNFTEFFKADIRNPEEEIIRAQQLRQVRSLLKKISPSYRRVLELRFFEELSYDEISEKMELPLGTVKTQIFRGKKVMEELIIKNGGLGLTIK